MAMLLAFAPFIAFAVLDRLAGGVAALIAGAVVAAILVARDLASKTRRPKLLEIGTLALFVGLALFAVIGGQSWSLFGVRLRVDLGLFLLVVLSLAIRRPFTLQYARETVAPELWKTEAFVRANYVITAVWALAFAALVGADALLVYAPNLSPRIGIIITIAALLGAFKFTSWYPTRQARIAA